MTQGARVIISDIAGNAAMETARELAGSTGHAHGEKLDVTDRAAAIAFAERIGRQYGNIHVLVNNAGVAGRAAFDDPHTPELWDQVMGVNLLGMFNVCYAFVPALKATRGSIVNMASVVAFVSGASTAGYVVSKGGVRSLTQVLARDLAPYGIRVNAVAPGIMMTEMAAAQIARPNGTDWFMDRVMMKRIGEAHEVVGPVLFLASAMASYVTGAVLPVDGGFLAA
jgi:NAD(P)-dependent dehydrogenase (short-subunit alcohol dehydrogenase family)